MSRDQIDMFVVAAEVLAIRLRLQFNDIIMCGDSQNRTAIKTVLLQIYGFTLLSGKMDKFEIGLFLYVRTVAMKKLQIYI